MALVDKLSNGRIGYVHVPDTAAAGNRMLHKMLLPQARKEGLIIDDRYNGGGFIPDRMMELLSRRTIARWARRNRAPMRTPGIAHDGPKALLMNGYSSSGGDALPYFFRQQGLGPLIGTRTWGGLIGLTGNPNLVDGGSVQVPTFRIFDAEGEWVIENEGVSPDFEVFDTAERIESGGDPSIERAVEWLLNQLEKQPVQEPAVPTPPVVGR
jgi:tricorn protease